MAIALAPGYGALVGSGSTLMPTSPRAISRSSPSKSSRARLLDLTGRPCPGRRGVRILDPTRARSRCGPSDRGTCHHRRPHVLVGPSDRPSRLAEARDDRRRRTVHGARPGSRAGGPAQRRRPAICAPDDRACDGRHSRREGRFELAPAGPVYHGSGDLCRHRQSRPASPDRHQRRRASSALDELRNRRRRSISRDWLVRRYFVRGSVPTPRAAPISPPSRESIGPGARSSRQSIWCFRGVAVRAQSDGRRLGVLWRVHR